MSEIQDSDYNSLRDLIVEVMGPGTGSFGYGQPIISSPVFKGNIITQEQWNNLRFDIINAKLHQDGEISGIVEVNTGDVIGQESGDPKTNFENVIESVRRNRFLVSPSTVQIESIASPPTFSSQWNTSAVFTVSMEFSDSNNARYFFNSGSQLEITPTLQNSTNTAQNNAWNNLLNEVGTVVFGISNEINFYDLTNSYQTIIESFSSAPYASNKVVLEAKSDAADNSTGTATEVDLRLSLIDGYVDPDVLEGFSASENSPSGFVDGDLNFELVEVKASGNLLPAGTGPFLINSPSYSVSPISAT